MPELPEVETSRRGIAPHLEGRSITSIIVRQRRLRWPISQDLERQLTGATIETVGRRAKYLLIGTSNGTAMLHLGMTGSVFIVRKGTPAGVHDHVDIELSSGNALRFRDPRRFGSLLWSLEPLAHPLLAGLGPEPLTETFTGHYLWQRARGRKVAVKQFIMSNPIVVGVGNIYASESLFMAGIHPKRAAGRVSLHRYERLAGMIREVLQRSIDAGGTTLRDFYGGDGEPGYFKQELAVYGRENEPCRVCNTAITVLVLGQRSTFYCKTCQR